MMLKVCLLVVALAIACNAQCGVPAITPLSSNRVVGGVEATANSWPWQISLRLKGIFGDSHFCGGSLISDQWVVTAAHCVDGRESSFYWNIWVGAHNVYTQNSNTIAVSTSGVFKHSGYDAQLITNDIALIKLSSPVSLTDYVDTVCLPSFTYTSGNGYVTGWGDTQESGQGSYPTYLQQAMTPIMDHATCDAIMAGMVDDTMICGGYDDGEKGACSGDSGGPFVVQTSTGEWELAGIVSWGYFPCAQYGVPSVYTDAYTFVPWIQSTMASNP